MWPVSRLIVFPNFPAAAGHWHTSCRGAPPPHPKKLRDLGISHKWPWFRLRGPDLLTPPPSAALGGGILLQELAADPVHSALCHLIGGGSATSATSPTSVWGKAELTSANRARLRARWDQRQTTDDNEEHCPGLCQPFIDNSSILTINWQQVYTILQRWSSGCQYPHSQLCQTGPLCSIAVYYMGSSSRLNRQLVRPHYRGSRYWSCYSYSCVRWITTSMKRQVLFNCSWFSEFESRRVPGR